MNPRKVGRYEPPHPHKLLDAERLAFAYKLGRDFPPCEPFGQEETFASLSGELRCPYPKFRVPRYLRPRRPNA